MSGSLQVVGALMVLAAFVAVQRGAASASAPAVLVLNLVGSAVLAVLALIGRQWGFLLLEGAWSAVSAMSLARDTLR